jgi:putative redox protein
VATIGAPSDPGHVSRLFEGDRDRIEAEGSAEVNLGGRRFRIARQFLADVEESRLEPHLAALDAAVLVCHSPEDEIVSIEHAGRIYKAAKHPKSFLSLSGADHLLSRKEDAVWVADLLAVWAGRYVAG